MMMLYPLILLLYYIIIVYYLESDESVYRRLRPMREATSSDTAECDIFKVTESSLILDQVYWEYITFCLVSTLYWNK
jgi:hypothetical protein